MLADVLYRDDLDRTLFSFDGWGVLGRPLSDFLIHMFSLNFDILPNTAPLPLITGLVITSIIIWYISESLTEDKNKAVFSLFLTLIVAIPFFIQNTNYQFDSFTMILATSLCILSFFIFNNKNIVSCLLSIAFLIASLCLYQPCVNIFIALVTGNAIYKYAKISNVNSLAVFLLSYLLYFILINYAFEMTSGRASYVPIVDIYQSFINSIKKVYFYFSLIGELYEYIVLIGAACFMYCYFKGLLKSKGSGCVNILFVALSPVAILIFLPGPAFLLSE
ncbi:glucosyltransferase domain-containing protein [Edwardsiella tarda]|uniref:glucosyltransferase domain-containing protein n=1 Tax=Edwardsiella tarda TaxID=636 RepID=UPI00351BFF90